MIPLESDEYEPGSRPWVEAQIGEAAALVLSIVFERLKEHRDGLPQSEVSIMGSSMLKCLIEWKLEPRLVDLDFEQTVRDHAPGALQRLYPDWKPNPEFVDQMLTDVLKMVNNVIKEVAN